ncbi:MAG: hypothetical protein ACREI4_02510 [Candidatus Rokuibacteriota bacterium]
MLEIVFALEFRGRGVDTVGRGHVGPAPGGSVSHGVVMWRITGGDGRFPGAQGLITSNFTVSPGGLVTDDRFTRLYLPDRAGSTASLGR